MAQAPDLSQRPENLHQRLTSPDDEGEDPLLAQTGCAAPYTRLEECLGEHDRDWTKCQKGGRPHWAGGGGAGQRRASLAHKDGLLQRPANLRVDS